MDQREHTFGGSALDRHVFDFETVADGSAASAGAPAGGEPSPTAPPAAEPAGAGGGEPVPPTGVTEPAPAWSPDDPAFLEAVDGRALELIDSRFGPLAELLQQTLVGGEGGGQPGGPQQLLPPDPFSDNYAQEFAAYQASRDEQMFGRFEQMLGQISQPLQAQMEQATVAEGNQRLQDMIADDIARHGDFPRAPGETESKAQQLVQPIAEALFPQVSSRYGNTPRAAEAAISQAAGIVRGLVAEAKTAGVEEYKNQLGTLAGVNGEPGTGAAGAQGLSDTQDPNEITRRYAQSGSALRVANG